MSEFVYDAAVGYTADDVNSPNSQFVFGTENPFPNAFGLSQNSFPHGLQSYETYNAGFDIEDGQMYYNAALQTPPLQPQDFNEFGKGSASCDLSGAIKKRNMIPNISPVCPPPDFMDGTMSSPVVIPFNLSSTPPLTNDMMYFGNDTSAHSPIFSTPLHMFNQVSPPDSPQDFASPVTNEDLEEQRNFCVTPELKYEMESGENSDSDSKNRVKVDTDVVRDHELYKDALPGPDGLYHCPWEGTNDCNHKPEKLKCNYDKYVDSHLRPYRCKMPSCEATRFSSTACLLRHEREAHRMHGHRALHCLYPGCERSVEGKGFPRAWNLRDHMRRVHNDNTYPAEMMADALKPKAPRRVNKETTSRPRKNSKSAAAAAAAALAQENARRQDEEWSRDFSELESMAHMLGNRKDPKNGDHIRMMQKKLEKMSSQLQAPIVSSVKPNHRRQSAGASE